VESEQDEWGRVISETCRTVAHEAAAAGTLPPDFNRWDIPDDFGWTVAHEAAKAGHLPPDFNRWELGNDYGWTVAHQAAAAGTLPPDFNRWDIANNFGWTVAHQAAEAGTLPPDFDKFDSWKFTDKRGRTVAQVAVRSSIARGEWGVFHTTQ